MNTIITVIQIFSLHFYFLKSYSSPYPARPPMLELHLFLIFKPPSLSKIT